MKLDLYILQKRGPQTPLEDAAAIVPEGVQLPEGYAVLDKVLIPEKIAEQLEPLFTPGATTQFTREALQGLLAIMGRIGHEAGIKLAKESDEV